MNPSIVLYGSHDAVAANAEVALAHFGLNRLLFDEEGTHSFVDASAFPATVREQGDLCLSASNLMFGDLRLVSIKQLKTILGDAFVST